MNSRQIELHDGASVVELDDGVRRGVLTSVTGQRARYWELRARLNVMVRRGEIGQEMIEVAGRDKITVYAVRLKPFRSPWRRRAAIALTVAASLSALAWMIWDARYVIMAALAALAALFVVITAIMYAGTHRLGCPGLHCAGCKG